MNIGYPVYSLLLLSISGVNILSVIITILFDCTVQYAHLY